jgi:hypothetical protein
MFPRRSTRPQAGWSLDWIAERIFGVVVTCVRGDISALVSDPAQNGACHEPYPTKRVYAITRD